MTQLSHNEESGVGRLGGRAPRRFVHPTSASQLVIVQLILIAVRAHPGPRGHRPDASRRILDHSVAALLVSKSAVPAERKMAVRISEVGGRDVDQVMSKDPQPVDIIIRVRGALMRFRPIRCCSGLLC